MLDARCAGWSGGTLDIPWYHRPPTRPHFSAGKLIPVEICQFSLWIKTAACAKQWTSLDHTIREGNRLVSDPAAHHKPRKGARDAAQRTQIVIPFADDSRWIGQRTPHPACGQSFPLRWGESEVICRFQSDGTLTFVNDVDCRFFDKSPQALIGQKWQPNVHPDDVPRIEERLCILCPANPVVVVENRVYSGIGKRRWIQFVTPAFFDASDQLDETQAVGRDVTERT